MLLKSKKSVKCLFITSALICREAPTDRMYSSDLTNTTVSNVKPTSKFKVTSTDRHIFVVNRKSSDFVLMKSELYIICKNYFKVLSFYFNLPIPLLYKLKHNLVLTLVCF